MLPAVGLFVEDDFFVCLKGKGNDFMLIRSEYPTVSVGYGGIFHLKFLCF